MSLAALFSPAPPAGACSTPGSNRKRSLRKNAALVFPGGRTPVPAGPAGFASPASSGSASGSRITERERPKSSAGLGLGLGLGLSQSTSATAEKENLRSTAPSDGLGKTVRRKKSTIQLTGEPVLCSRPLSAGLGLSGPDGEASFITALPEPPSTAVSASSNGSSTSSGTVEKDRSRLRGRASALFSVFALRRGDDRPRSQSGRSHSTGSVDMSGREKDCAATVSTPVVMAVSGKPGLFSRAKSRSRSRLRRWRSSEVMGEAVVEHNDPDADYLPLNVPHHVPCRQLRTGRPMYSLRGRSSLAEFSLTGSQLDTIYEGGAGSGGAANGQECEETDDADTTGDAREKELWEKRRQLRPRGRSVVGLAQLAAMTSKENGTTTSSPVAATETKSELGPKRSLKRRHSSIEKENIAPVVAFAETSDLAGDIQIMFSDPVQVAALVLPRDVEPVAAAFSSQVSTPTRTRRRSVVAQPIHHPHPHPLRHSPAGGGAIEVGMGQAVMVARVGRGAVVVG